MKKHNEKQLYGETLQQSNIVYLFVLCQEVFQKRVWALKCESS